jgi:LAO/AO transport system kinase
VINKSDRRGADDTRRDIQQMLELSSLGDWEPPILMTVGTEGDGAQELWTTIGEHRSYLEQSGELSSRRRNRIKAELLKILNWSLEARVQRVLDSPKSAELHEKLESGEIDPYAAAERLLEIDESD